MSPSCLTILAPIRRGEEAALGAILRAIGDDIKGKRLTPGERPHVDFLRCPLTHFARFAILNDPTVKASAYLFMPSLTALRFLAQTPNARTTMK